METLLRDVDLQHELLAAEPRCLRPPSAQVNQHLRHSVISPILVAVVEGGRHAQASPLLAAKTLIIYIY